MQRVPPLPSPSLLCALCQLVIPVVASGFLPLGDFAGLCHSARAGVGLAVVLAALPADARARLAPAVPPNKAGAVRLVALLARVALSLSSE